MLGIPRIKGQSPYPWYIHRQVREINLQMDNHNAKIRPREKTGMRDRMCSILSEHQGKREWIIPYGSLWSLNKSDILAMLQIHRTPTLPYHIPWLCLCCLHLLGLLLILLHLADLAQISFPLRTLPYPLSFSPSFKISAPLIHLLNCLWLHFRTYPFRIKLSVLCVSPISL